MSDHDDKPDDDPAKSLTDPAPLEPHQPLQEAAGDDPLQFLDALCLDLQELRGPAVPCQELTASALAPLEPTLPLGNLRTVEYAHQLLERGPYGLADALRWAGDDCAGVMTLYYCGPADQRLIHDQSSRLPLVIGSDNDCIKRLKGFAISIQQVGLGLENFTARFLPLSAKLKEDAKKSLEQLYRPLWFIFDGFLARQYAPDQRGADSTRSKWDSLFPGRIGAGQVERGEDLLTRCAEEIPNVMIRYRRVERHLAAYRYLAGL